MKHLKYLLLLSLCLLLAACGPKEPAPETSSVPEASSQPGSASPPAPNVSEPDVSAPDASEPSASSQEDLLPPLTEEDKAAAYDAALDYYTGTVFEVHSLTQIEALEGEIMFQVSCSKGGAELPDRTICLERQEGAWTVINEGY